MKLLFHRKRTLFFLRFLLQIIKSSKVISDDVFIYTLYRTGKIANCPCRKQLFYFIIMRVDLVSGDYQRLSWWWELANCQSWARPWTRDASGRSEAGVCRRRAKRGGFLHPREPGGPSLGLSRSGHSAACAHAPTPRRPPRLLPSFIRVLGERAPCACPAAELLIKLR